MHQIEFGDGSDPQNDMQNALRFNGDYPNWIGRSYGKTANIKTPMNKVFGAADWGSDWHTFKIMVKFNDGDSAENEVANGAYHVEIDGNVYADATGLFNRHFASGAIDHIGFGGWAQGSRNAPNPAFDLYYDDIVVTRDGWLDSNNSLSSASVLSSSRSSTSSISSSNASVNTNSSAITASQSSVSSVGATTGLIWPNGIEPGDPSQCEAPTNKRCWWVDASATSGGNGDFLSPYNSFEMLEQNVRGGDFVYLRGIFDMAKNSIAHQMTLNIHTLEASGTAANPTTLKSWRGSPRAVFASNGTRAQVRMRNNGGMRLQNLELSGFQEQGIVVDSGVSYAEFVNVIVHDGTAPERSGVDGGLVIAVQDSFHRMIVRNSLFYNIGGAEAGAGALSILGDPAAIAGSSVSIYNSVFHNNQVAINHKSSGQVHVEAYNNRIENNTFGFNLRSWSGDIHHNIIVGNKIAVGVENAGLTTNHDYTIQYNTFYNNDYYLQAGPDWDNNLFHSSVHTQNNIVVASAQSLGIYYLGSLDWNWGNVDRSLPSWTMNNNLFYFPADMRSFLYSPAPTTAKYSKDFAAAKIQFADITSINADPLFVDSAHGDFSLKANSPAIGLGSNGTTPGAFGGHSSSSSSSNTNSVSP